MDVIREMKKQHPGYFFTIGVSCIVLIRYDGKVEKLSLSENLPDLKVWINLKSTKMVDVYNTDA